MRIILLTALCSALIGANLVAGPPVFDNGYKSNRLEAQPAQPTTSFGRFFGGQPAQPGFATPAPPLTTPPPTTTQRFSQAITNNPLVAAARPSNWGDRRTQPVDSLSLNRPVTQPTADMLIALAGVAEQAGDTETARKHLQNAVTQSPNNTVALRRLGRLEDRLGRLAEAANLYRRAVDANPQHAGALNDLALCYARQGGLIASTETLERAIALRPDKPLYRNNIAKVLVASGNEPAALGHLAAVHPPAVAHFNLGQLLAQAGRTNEAVNHLRQSVGFDPAFQPAAAALAKLSPAGIAIALPAPPPEAYATPAPPYPVGPQPGFVNPTPGWSPPQTARAPQLQSLPPIQSR